MSLPFARQHLLHTFVILLLLGSVPGKGLMAAEGGTASDEDRIVQRVTQEVMKQLHDSDFLQKEIEQGIHDYIEKQREMRAEAKADRAHKASEAAKNVRRVSVKRDHIFGNPNAEVSLIEYADFECPFCKRFYPIPKQVVKDYGGRVNWVYRHFLLTFQNPGNRKEAEASECAAALGGNKAFWAYAGDIYTRTTSNGNGFPVAKLTPLAKEIGLDETAFKKCLDSGEYANRVREDMEEGMKVGISGTPSTIFLNNKTGEARLLYGALPISTIEAKINEILK